MQILVVRVVVARSSRRSSDLLFDCYPFFASFADSTCAREIRGVEVSVRDQMMAVATTRNFRASRAPTSRSAQRNERAPLAATPTAGGAVRNG